MKRAHIEVVADGLVVDGMTLNYERIAELLYDMAHPDPERWKWYRFERIGDVCVVHLQMTTKQVPEGSHTVGSAILSHERDGAEA